MASSPEERLAEELAAHGLRATRQRVETLRMLRRRSLHPTAGELHRSVRRALPNVSLKTIYQVLDSFVSVGLASCVTEGGEPFRYEAGMEPHYHARCRACGGLVDLPASCDGLIRGRAPLPENFQVERIVVTIVGLCERCRDDF